MRFSRTRLSEIVHRTAVGAAVYHFAWHSPSRPDTVPSGALAPFSGVSSLRIHQRFPPSDTPTKCGPFPPRALPRFSSTTDHSDSRSALPHFTGTPLIGFVAPSPPLGWHPRGLTAGAETGLSCSHDGFPIVPRPLRRRVLRCCASKLFTPSMAFARGHEARLPVDPLRGRERGNGHERSN